MNAADRIGPASTITRVIPRAGKRAQHGRKVEPPVACRHAQHLDAGLRQRALLAPAGAARVDEHPVERARRASRRAANAAAAAMRCRAPRAPASACSMPGSRQVSCGSSASTVPMPVRIASFIARIRCTRVARRLAGDRGRLAARQPGLAVGRDRKLQRHMRAAVAHAADMAGMRAPRFLARRARHRPRRPAARSRAWPSPAIFGLGSSSAETTRAMPAAMMASAQGGVLP